MAPTKRAAARAGEHPGWLALLRGLNVGGRNVLPMADLATIFADAGGADVQTYIQSGNVLFDASPRRAAEIPATVSALIEERFGLRVPVVLRSAKELGRVAAGNPFLRPAGKPTVDLSTLQVLFLAESPDPKRVASLDPAASPGDAFVVQGREVYLHLPNGAGRSKLTTALFDRALGTTTTARNWRTLLALAERLGAAPDRR